jgi:hypothetical protein
MVSCLPGWVLRKAAGVRVVSVLVVMSTQGLACWLLAGRWCRVPSLLAAVQGCRTRQGCPGLAPAAACLRCPLVDFAVVAWEAHWALEERPAQAWMAQQGQAALLVVGQYRARGEGVLVVGMAGVAVVAWVVGVGA